MLQRPALKMLIKGAPLSRLAIPKFNFSVNEKNSYFKIKTGQTTSDIISRNLGLSRFLTRTYNTTGLAVGGALGAGYIASMLPLFLINPMATTLGGGILALLSFLGVNKMRYTASFL